MRRRDFARGAGRRAGGFTLADVLVTAVIVTIMAGVSVPLIVPRYQEYQLRGAAWQMAGDMRLARQRAVTTRAPYRFAFATSAGGAEPDSYILEYQLEQGAVRTWVQEVPPGPGSRQRLSGAIHIDAASTPSNGAAVGTGTIVFYPNGSVVPTGTLRLRGPRGGLNVVVDQTGRVQVREP